MKKQELDSSKAYVSPMDEAKKAIKYTIPAGLWTAATIWACVPAFNSGDVFHIVCGGVAIIGAICTTVMTYKKHQ